jgi:hypothetical protein
MPLPRGLVSAFVIICERLLVEKDDVQSAIRIADLFQFQKIPGAPSEDPVVPITVIIQARFTPDAEPTHTLELRLIRPDGETKTIGEPVTLTMAAKFPDVCTGYNSGAIFGVAARINGIHYVTFLIDGEEVARAPFSLLEKRPE